MDIKNRSNAEERKQIGMISDDIEHNQRQLWLVFKNWHLHNVHDFLNLCVLCKLHILFCLYLSFCSPWHIFSLDSYAIAPFCACCFLHLEQHSVQSCGSLWLELTPKQLYLSCRTSRAVFPFESYGHPLVYDGSFRDPSTSKSLSS